ncbi:MAG: hypothetical protein H0T92_07435 [Pyrinomonadaceae bacterium]|nr:hypothetical protein [Pyrinomonadaceae bacterium]
MPPPITIKSGSFIIESDEPLNLDPRTISECKTSPTPDRPYKYLRHKSEEEIRTGEKQIRFVIVRNLITKEEFPYVFKEKECEIDIYWEPPNLTTSAA